MTVNALIYLFLFPLPPTWHAEAPLDADSLRARLSEQFNCAFARHQPRRICAVSLVRHARKVAKFYRGCVVVVHRPRLLESAFVVRTCCRVFGRNSDACTGGILEGVHWHEFTSAKMVGRTEIVEVLGRRRGRGVKVRMRARQRKLGVLLAVKFMICWMKKGLPYLASIDFW